MEAMTASETQRLCLDVSFTSVSIHKLFMNYISSNKCITIHSMDNNGRFQGEITPDINIVEELAVK